MNNLIGVYPLIIEKQVRTYGFKFHTNRINYIINKLFMSESNYSSQKIEIEITLRLTKKNINKTFWNF